MQWARPASLHRSRNQLPKPAAVNGLPYAVTRKVRSPVVLAAMIRASSGSNGFSESRCAERVLRGINRSHSVLHMLAAQRHHVAPPGAREQQERERKPGLGADRVTFLKSANLSAVQVWNPSVAYLMRRTSRAGFVFMNCGVVSIAHPNIALRYLRRLFAAPGNPPFKSRSRLTFCGDTFASGQNPIGSGSPSLRGPWKHASEIPAPVRLGLGVKALEFVGREIWAPAIQGYPAGRVGAPAR